MANSNLLGMKITQVAVIISFLLCGLFITGCGFGGSPNPQRLASKYDKAFGSADAEAKGMWDGAKSAMQTNGYVAALQNLESLIAYTNVSPEQVTAARETVNAVSDKMYAAANKGDAAAKDAIEEYRKVRTR